MGAMASQITSVSIVYSIVCSWAEQRKHQSSASMVFVRGSHRWPVNSPHKGPVKRKIFPFDDVIMEKCNFTRLYNTLSYHKENIYIGVCLQSIKNEQNCVKNIFYILLLKSICKTQEHICRYCWTFMIYPTAILANSSQTHLKVNRVLCHGSKRLIGYSMEIMEYM